MSLEQRQYDPANMYGAVDSLGATAYTGAVTMASTLAVTGASTFTGTATFTALKIPVLASSGNTTMTTAMTGSTMLIDGASTDYALPAVGSGDVGVFYNFVATIISTGTQTITAQAADLLTGAIAIIDAGAVGSDTFSPNVSSDLVITLNGTTTGGVAVGSWCQLTCISSTRWFVQGVFNGSGTLATPFS